MLTPRLVAGAAIAAASSLSAVPASACAVCGCGDPTLTVTGFERPFEGRIRLSADVRFGSARVGTPNVDEIQIRERRFDVTAAYAPTRSLFLSLAFPLLHRDARSADGTSAAAFGPGDLELRAKQFVWQARRGPFQHQAAIQGGVKAPTAPLQSDAAGRALPVALQPGTGAITPFAGVFYGFGRAPWSFYASATVYLPYAVRKGPHAATSFRTSATVQYQIGRVFASRLGVNTRLDKTGEAEGKADPNSGGFVTYVSPEIVVSPVGDLVLLAGVHVPVLQALYGWHREGAIVSVGAAYDF